MSSFAALNGGQVDSKIKASVSAAFPNDVDLQHRIIAATETDPELMPLFSDIAQNVLHSRGQGIWDGATQASKKRKLEDSSSLAPAQSQTNGDHSGRVSAAQSLFSCKDVSFQIPMRKKLKLDVVSDAKDPVRQEVRLVNQTSNQTEYALPMSDIEQAFCMAVPDKQARQANFVFYPKAEAGVEPVVFALNDTAPAAGTVTGGDAAEEGDTYPSITERALGRMLGSNGIQLVKPTDDEFASAIPQSHRKGEKAYHVRAHRGSKEGYLYFLSTGIFFGFKKPLAFFPFAAIESISYTAVLQRTFNLVITSTTVNPSTGVEETKDHEFSMLDQADFAGIDEYVKRHGLNDASMAAQRRAKAYNVNKVKTEDGVEAGGVEGDAEGELAKAEQAIQDAEDEEEEDYEASGGESDGEGEESEDDEDGYGEEGEREDDEDDAEGDEEL